MGIGENRKFLLLYFGFWFRELKGMSNFVKVLDYIFKLTPLPLSLLLSLSQAVLECSLVLQKMKVGRWGPLRKKLQGRLCFQGCMERYYDSKVYHFDRLYFHPAFCCYIVHKNLNFQKYVVIES